MEEAAGSQAQAAAGYAPWESVEEKEEDMGRLLEGGEKEGAGQRARTVPRKAGSGDQLGRICRLCDGEATGDCTKGNCEDCCMSNRGEGPFNCCKGPHSYSSSHSSVCLSVVTSQQQKHGRQWMRSRRQRQGRQ